MNCRQTATNHPNQNVSTPTPPPPSNSATTAAKSIFCQQLCCTPTPKFHFLEYDFFSLQFIYNKKRAHTAAHLTLFSLINLFFNALLYILNTICYLEHEFTKSLYIEKNALIVHFFVDVAVVVE